MRKYVRKKCNLAEHHLLLSAMQWKLEIQWQLRPILLSNYIMYLHYSNTFNVVQKQLKGLYLIYEPLHWCLLSQATKPNFEESDYLMFIFIILFFMIMLLRWLYNCFIVIYRVYQHYFNVIYRIQPLEPSSRDISPWYYISQLQNNMLKRIFRKGLFLFVAVF